MAMPRRKRYRAHSGPVAAHGSSQGLQIAFHGLGKSQTRLRAVRPHDPGFPPGEGSVKGVGHSVQDKDLPALQPRRER